MNSLTSKGSALLFFIFNCVSYAYAMNMDEACGNASNSMLTESPGRWLPWTNDHLDQDDLDPVLIGEQKKLLTELFEPFMRLDVLKPPPGVEMRPHRSMGTRAQMAEPMPGAKLMIQTFHPTYKQAGESSAGVKAYINNLLPLFYGIGGGEIKDEKGPMFSEPIRVGELGGAPVYWSERKRDCIVVFKAHQKPLWKPVSQERYLLSIINGFEKKIAAARKTMNEERIKHSGNLPGQDLSQQQQMIEQMKAINPEAAKQMEKQFAIMQQKIQQQLPKMQQQADVMFSNPGAGLYPEINKFKVELAALSVAERRAPAHLGGINGSKTTLLSQPDDMGSRALVAPVTDYFSDTSSPSKAQLLIIEFASQANHSPEMFIMTRLRKDLNWNQFWRFVVK